MFLYTWILNGLAPWIWNLKNLFLVSEFTVIVGATMAGYELIFLASD